MTAFPKPWQRKPNRLAVRVFMDGREVCDVTRRAGYDEYERRKRLMWERQGKKCFLCGQTLFWKDATFEHQDGRGMGGSKRDDRIEKDGQPYNGVAHLLCNQTKGSQSLEKWLDQEITI
jgi:hypothetical protein